MAASIDGFTLSEAQAQLAAWKAAISGLATSQSYTIGQRTLTRVNLGEAREMVTYFAGIVSALQAGQSGRSNMRRVVPRDL